MKAMWWSKSTTWCGGGLTNIIVSWVWLCCMLWLVVLGVRLVFLF